MKIYVPIISYNGNVCTEFMFSMMSFQQYLIQKKYPTTFYPITFESLIPRARNAAASNFLQSDMEYLFFVDTDITFSPQDFEKLLNLDKEVSAGVYVKKYLNKSKLNFLAKHEKDDEILKHVEELSTDFSSEINIHNKKLSDSIEVEYAATGFMLIKKSAFYKIIEKFPEIEYKNDIDGYGVSQNKFYDFFPSKINDNKKYLSEDYGFCDLYKKAGGTIYCATNTNLCHIGRKAYTGNIQKQSLYWSNVS
jgi:hypothetical protein